MALKNILVHLDPGPRSADRLALAMRLAERHEARLTGVFADLAEAHRVGVIAQWPPAIYAEAAAASREAFAAQAGALGTEWIDLNRGGEEEILRRMSQLAGQFDLLIAGQHDETQRAYVPPTLPTHVCATSGRPVLVVPYAGHFETIGRRPIFAWGETAGAARALTDALPLLSPDADALVLYAYERDQRNDFAERVIPHLERHGVKARFEPFVLEEETVMDVLLNFASDHGADLMTLGIAGRAGAGRFERGRGGMPTLRQLTVPVLCAG